MERRSARDQSGFIRKASIDELPQLINVVFKGNLSLVGLRPHALHSKAADRLYDEAVDGYFARHRVEYRRSADDSACEEAKKLHPNE